MDNNNLPNPNNNLDQNDQMLNTGWNGIENYQAQAGMNQAGVPYSEPQSTEEMNFGVLDEYGFELSDGSEIRKKKRLVIALAIGLIIIAGSVIAGILMQDSGQKSEQLSEQGANKGAQNQKTDDKPNAPSGSVKEKMEIEAEKPAEKPVEKSKEQSKPAPNEKLKTESKQEPKPAPKKDNNIKEQAKEKLSELEQMLKSWVEKVKQTRGEDWKQWRGKITMKAQILRGKFLRAIVEEGGEKAVVIFEKVKDGYRMLPIEIDFGKMKPKTERDLMEMKRQGVPEEMLWRSSEELGVHKGLSSEMQWMAQAIERSLGWKLGAIRGMKVELKQDGKIMADYGRGKSILERKADGFYRVISNSLVR